jgi:hypothetical protein
MDQMGEQHSTLASDAIREEEIEASNSEGQKQVTDVFKHPSALVWKCNVWNKTRITILQ